MSNKNFFLTVVVILSMVYLSTEPTPLKANSGILDESTLMNQDITGSKHLQTVVLGAGCFWGAEKRYQAIPGVIEAVSGYAGGMGVKPNYRAITASKNKNNRRNHAEVVKVIYNESVVNLETILRSYFEGHDPTQRNRQGNDIGTQYRSIVLTNNKMQTDTVNKVLAEYQLLLDESGYGVITTQVKSLTKFYPAEKYHQDYLAKNPNGYCPDHSTGVTFVKNNNKVKVDNSALLKGKQIVVIEAEGYCAYCEQFKKDVLDDYKGTIPVTARLATQLERLTVKTPTWATPTILFLEDGKEIYGKQGYMSPKKFYKFLGAFKLGNTEAYRVAFKEGTDAKFCKEYKIFKNTPDGVFIDKLSGVALFDTRDRFNSKTGWLSFTQAIKDSTYQLADKSYGMNRVEIRSKSSDIHLGHVFPDGPGGKPRFCINATVLEFIPRNKT